MTAVRLRAAVAALLLLANGPASAKAPPPPHPALWKLADADTTIYLFGTVHALPPGYAWEDDRLRAAIAAADRLVIEAVIDPATSAALLLRLGTNPNLPPLADRVKPAKRDLLARMIADTKLPPAMFDHLETWAACLILVGSSITRLGLSGGDGIEAGLRTAFAGAHKPIEGLETAELQLGIFKALSEDQQRAFLDSVVNDPKDDRRDFDRLLAAWARGSDKTIARISDKEMRDSPQLNAVLLEGRNRRWVDALIADLAQPGTMLVAVGADHLAGAKSVQAMLGQRGYKVERLR